MLRTLALSMFFLFSLVFLPQLSIAGQQTTGLSTGIPTEMKAYFDIKADSSTKVEKRLVWINEMYEQMTAKGVKVSFIIGFRSQASYYVTKGDEYIYEEDFPSQAKIKKLLKHFTTLGIRLEQCELSAKIFDIELEYFLPELTLVKNSYVTMIVHQNAGYAYVPM